MLPELKQILDEIKTLFLREDLWVLSHNLAKLLVLRQSSWKDQNFEALFPLKIQFFQSAFQELGEWVDHGFQLSDTWESNHTAIK